MNLLTAIKPWEKEYYEGTLPDTMELPLDKQSSFDERGHELARALSLEVGDAFEVEYVSYYGNDLHFKVTEPGTNSAAIAAFREIVRRDEEVG